jgi:hypothetical protein
MSKAQQILRETLDHVRLQDSGRRTPSWITSWSDEIFSIYEIGFKK